VIVSSEDPEQADKGAERLASSARALLAEALPEYAETDGRRRCELLGPAEAAFPKLRRRHRRQLLIKGNDAAWVARLSRHLAEAGRRLGSGLQVSVDVDPVNML
jgi:primosomal protein N'